MNRLDQIADSLRTAYFRSCGGSFVGWDELPERARTSWRRVALTALVGDSKADTGSAA